MPGSVLENSSLSNEGAGTPSISRKHLPVTVLMSGSDDPSFNS